MRLEKIFIVLVIFLQGCSAAKQYYSGEKKPKEEISIFALKNVNSFFSDTEATTIELDDLDFTDPGISLSSAGRPVLYAEILPGNHRAKLTINNYDMFLLPTPWVVSFNVKTTTYKGWYEMNFETKPGMMYAPKFKEVHGKPVTSEICVVEVAQSEGISGSRDSTNFIACGGPKFEIEEASKELCDHLKKSEVEIVNPEVCAPL